MMHHTCFGTLCSYTVSESKNRVYDAATLRIAYSSPITPPTIYDYGFETQALQLKKRVCISHFFAVFFWGRASFVGTFLLFSHFHSCYLQKFPITIRRCTRVNVSLLRLVMGSRSRYHWCGVK